MLRHEVPTQCIPSHFRNHAYRNCPYRGCDHDVGEAVQVPLVLLQFCLWVSSSKPCRLSVNKEQTYPVLDSHISYVCMPDLAVFRGTYCLKDGWHFHPDKGVVFGSILIWRYT